jgi:hypothetical protein
MELSPSEPTSHSGTQYFSEPEGCSLLCSHEPATGPYFEPDESSTYLSILFL